MKYAILGDIHANLEALTAVLEAATALDVDAYICLGDIVGYNANPSACVELIQGLACETVIKGNHDEQAAIDSDLVGFNPQAASAISWTRDNLEQEQKDWLNQLPLQETMGHRVTLVHSTLDNPHNWGYIFDRFTAGACINYQRTQVCFYGHTHVPLLFEKFVDIDGGMRYDEVELKAGHKYLFNVSSVGQPRDGDPRAGFAVYDPDERFVKLHRVVYDVETCQKKIIRAGLPERLAQRLASGR